MASHRGSTVSVGEIFGMCLLLWGLMYFVGMRLTFGNGDWISEVTNAGAISLFSTIVIGHKHLLAIAAQSSPIRVVGTICIYALDTLFFGLVSLLSTLVLARYLLQRAPFKLATLCGISLVALVFLLCAMQAHAMTFWLPLWPELISAGTAPMDMAFHTSLAQLMSGFGVVSLGIDGLVPINYHVATHSLVIAASSLINAEVSWVFGAFYPLFAIPVLFFSALLLLEKISKHALATQYWSVLAWFFVIMSFGVWQAFASETYALSLILIIVVLNLLWEMKEPSIGRCLLLALLVGVTSLVKMPSGFAVGFLIGSYFVVRGHWKVQAFGLGLLVGGAPFALSLLYFAGGEGALGVPIDPFGFYARYPELAIPPVLFFVVALIWTFRKTGNRVPPTVQACLWTMATLLVVSAIFNAGSGSTAYFANQVVWLFLPVVAFLASRFTFKGVLAPILMLLAVVATVNQLEKRTLRAFDQRVIADRNWINSSVLNVARRQIGRIDQELDGVFISSDHEKLWTQSKQCRTAPMAAVGALGLPLLQGHPPLEFCERNDGHGYHLFPLETALAKPLSENPDERLEELCRRASIRQMTVLFEMTSSANFLVDCDAGTRKLMSNN